MIGGIRARGDALLHELERRLRVHDRDLLFEVTESGAAHIRTKVKDDKEPVVLFATEEQLAAGVTAVGEECRDSLWPASTVTSAGFKLLLTHLDEIVSTRGTIEPIVMTRQGWQWPESPEQTYTLEDDDEPGDFVWMVHRDADIATIAAAAKERDTRHRQFVLRALLGAELAYEAGQIPDETLAVVQDHAASELGSMAEARLAAQSDLTADDLRAARGPTKRRGLAPLARRLTKSVSSLRWPPRKR